MAETMLSRRLWMRTLYVALSLAVILLHLLPLGIARPSPLEPGPWLARVWAAPDLVVALTFAWAVRRPEYVPILAVAGVGLTADLLLQRPPGLGAALLVLGTETLRARAPGLRDQTFLSEWGAVASTLLLMILGERLMLTVVMADRAPLALVLARILTTLAAYPAVVLASAALMGVRRRAPAEPDPTGRTA